MGLAAGQARLLTITGRKSDCEFASMRLSHQKIALSRELADLSNEYQNSLNQTKLIYDYYGTGDTSTPLSYNVLMTPSALNNYMPIIATDSLGRVTLNSKYAAAARAAGIPQEGLGTMPSENLRNAYIQGLAQSGIITDKMANTIMGLPYNQAAGLGGGATVAIQTKDVTLTELAEYLDNYPATKPLAVDGCNTYDIEYSGLYNRTTGEYDIFNIEGTRTGASQNVGKEYAWALGSGVSANNTSGYDKQVSIGSLLTNEYVLLVGVQGNKTSTIGNTDGAIMCLINSPVWESMMSACEQALSLGDGYTEKALEYARKRTAELIDYNAPPWQKTADNDDGDKYRYTNYDTSLPDGQRTYVHINGRHTKDPNGDIVKEAANAVYSDKDGFIGFVAIGNTDSGHDDKNDCKSVLSVNISSILKAYLTYFADFMNGISKTDSTGIQVYDVNKQIATSHLVNDTTKFTIKTGSEVSSDDCGQATFYDALFNQICANGWTENNNVDDNAYLQEMLQSGMLYISTIKDDGYYYQGNYATHSYIKEIPDETKIAAAESKYNTEKAKLNAKEETLDLKMKNLDTEISSLTTEYDTIKNTISKNIETGFKRYG